jgi:hypothetical protein
MTTSLRFTPALLTAAALIGGCGSVELRTELQRIDIASEVFLVLPRASELTESFDATQVISAAYADESHTFEAYVEARPGKLTIVGINTIGMVLFSITYDGTEMIASGVAEAQVVNARYMLADVLMSHWDAEWLIPRLEGATLGVNESSRTVRRNGDVIIEISYDSGSSWSGNARFVHHERGYSLRIENVEFAEQ